MKSLIAFLLLLQLSGPAGAQIAATKQPKLRMLPTLFTTKYELGDRMVNAKEVQLHLEKTTPAAYYFWRSAERAERAGTVWSLAGLAGLLTGLLVKDDTASLLGYSVAVGAYTGALVCTINSAGRRKKAVHAYNQQYAY